MKDEYFQLLSEQDLDHEQAHWHTVKANISEDPRYKAIESSHRRKDLFKEYVQQFQQVLNGWRFSDMYTIGKYFHNAMFSPNSWKARDVVQNYKCQQAFCIFLLADCCDISKYR